MLAQAIDLATKKHTSYIVTDSGLNPDIEHVLIANPFFIQEPEYASWYDSRHGEYLVNSTLHLLRLGKMTVSESSKATIVIVACHMCLPFETAKELVLSSKITPLFNVPIDDVIALLEYTHGMGTKPSGELGIVAEVLADADVFLPYFLASTDDIRSLLRYNERHQYATLSATEFHKAFSMGYRAITPLTPVMREYLEEHREPMNKQLEDDLIYEAMFG